MTDAPTYYRLVNGLPCMVWPHESREEALIQIGRERPKVVSRYTEKDAESLNVVLLKILGGTDHQVSAADWHNAMSTGIWPDCEPVIWERTL